jgi:NAD(P)-dependent dehydrogenase (short-subunit alcohol dehydrogenase family)
MQDIAFLVHLRHSGLTSPTNISHPANLRYLSDAECRAQFETNFFGPVTLSRLILPSMKSRRSGIIVNISSTAGIEAKPSRTMYSGSKFALEAFSESLYHEMKPFNVRVLIVEPGAFRTGMPNALVAPEKPLPEEYNGTITQLMLSAMQAGTFKPKGDVEKAVRAIFDVVTGTGQAEGMEEFLRLPLGKDGSERWTVKLEDLRRNLAETENIWSMTDVDE